MVSSAAVLRVLCEKDYEQGTCLCNNFNFRQEMEFRCCLLLFGMIILGKGDSAKVSALFCTFLHSTKLVIYVFMGHNFTSICILYAWMILNLLMLYIITCYVGSNI